MLHKADILLVHLLPSLLSLFKFQFWKLKTQKTYQVEKIRGFLVTYISLLKNITEITVPETKFDINMKSAGYFKISKWWRDREGIKLPSH